ncbi:unnamed protein product [Meganyctiphanes norvegica]|uniref:SAM domain-containing protein n=1 Tax=Meganyctiphanes norvegica TaxID=48144 RepID=A0AAV2S3A4_MEGNR
MVAMTDLDTSGGTPVVWPKWCYAAAKPMAPHVKDSISTDTEAQDLVLNNNNITSVGKDKELMAPNSVHALKKHKKIRRDLPNGVPREEHPRDSSESKNDVKSERLSPDPGSDSHNVTTTVVTSRTTPSPSTSPKSDKSPASHRTRTPSFPGTPPHPAFTPPGGLPPGFERFSPAAALGGMGPFPGGPPPGAIKQMESLMNRNCSDLMRSLAAKYNNTNPNDYFSNPQNGYLRPPGLGAFKPSGPSPFLGLPPSTTITPQPPAAVNERKPEAPQAPSSVGPAMPHPGAPGSMFPGAPGHLPGFPPFPLPDVSSTQVLMNLMRNASASQQAQLENYLRGATKRPGENPTSPLDLSASVPNKRIRTDLGAKPFDVKNFLSIPQEEERRSEPVRSPQANRSPTPSKPRQSPTPNIGHSRTSPIPCSDKNCNSLESVAHWTVEDVVSFVASIELCAEYSEAFRENRIDGSSLPLLTEEHLTSSINMKLGPALKLRSVLARKLGACNVCLHCDHCHTQPQDRRQATT